VPKYVLSFRAAKDYVPFEDPSAVTAWAEFLTQAVEPVVVNPGWPVFEPTTIVGEGGPSTKLGGYAIIEVDSADEAVAIAERCPTLASGGGVEIGALAELPPEHPAEQMRAKLGAV
jgi:hypothetical protein